MASCVWTGAGVDPIYPLLALLLVDVFGAGAIALGTIEGIAESTAASLKVASGWWTDRVRRRKPLVVGGYELSGLVRPLIGLAATWPVAVLLRFGRAICGEAVRRRMPTS